MSILAFNEYPLQCVALRVCILCSVYQAGSVTMINMEEIKTAVRVQFVVAQQFENFHSSCEVTNSNKKLHSGSKSRLISSKVN